MCRNTELDSNNVKIFRRDFIYTTMNIKLFHRQLPQYISNDCWCVGVLQCYRPDRPVQYRCITLLPAWQACWPVQYQLTLVNVNETSIHQWQISLTDTSISLTDTSISLPGRSIDRYLIGRSKSLTDRFISLPDGSISHWEIDITHGQIDTSLGCDTVSLYLWYPSATLTYVVPLGSVWYHGFNHITAMNPAMLRYHYRLSSISPWYSWYCCICAIIASILIYHYQWYLQVCNMTVFVQFCIILIYVICPPPRYL